MIPLPPNAPLWLYGGALVLEAFRLWISREPREEKRKAIQGARVRVREGRGKVKGNPAVKSELFEKGEDE